MISRRIRHARRAYDAPRPLFPGYIFVRHQPERATYRPVLGTHGVKALMRTGERPSLLSGGFVEGLRARESGGVICKPVDPLSVGQKVCVKGGPLDGLVGEILELREKDRVLVLLNLLDQQTRTQMSSAMLNPL